jgi:L-aminopeptidase/D-esterase-like protein
MSKIAQMAHDGFARSINPMHTIFDGDTILVLSSGKASSVRAAVSAIRAIAATVMARALMQAESPTEHQFPAHRDYVKE